MLFCRSLYLQDQFSCRQPIFVQQKVMAFNKAYYKPIIISIVALLSAYLLWDNLNSTAEYDPSIFALKEPALVDRFTFTPNDENKFGLTFFKNQQGDWLIHNSKDTFPADTNNINMLLYWAVAKLKVQRPVNDEQKKYLVRQLAMEATKATFYSEGKAFHTIYIGGSTQDNSATFMYKPEMERPCIVEIAGFNGYLTPYFNTDIHLWRSLNLIDIPVGNIKNLTVSWPANPKNGFSISQKDEQLSLIDTNGNTVESNQSLLTGYLMLCSSFTREAGSIAGINRHNEQRDSVLSQQPVVIFRYELTDNSIQELAILPNNGFEDVSIDAKPSETQAVQSALFWMKSSEDDNLWLTQDIILKNRMKTLNDFRP